MNSGLILRIAQSYRSAFSGLSKETWLLSGVLLINRCGTMVVPFMSMYITQSMHRSIADAGLIITLFGVGSVLGSMAGGYFIDKIGFRPVQIFTSITGGLLFMIFGQVNNFPVLCFLTVALSFVAEAFRPANLTAVTTYSAPQNLTRSYSLNRLAVNLGWGLGSSLGGILAAINYHLLFWVEGGVYILVGLLILILLPARKQVTKELPVTHAHAGAGSPWKDKFLLRFLIIVTMFTTCFILMFRLVPVYWKETLHIGESVIGLLLGLNGIVIALFEMVLVRYWESRKPGIYYIVAGVIATASAYLLLVVPGIPPFLIATGAVLLLTLGEMLSVSFINSMVMKRANEQNKGKYAAAYTLSWSVALIFGPAGGALIIENWNYHALWIIVGALCLVCAFAFTRLSKS